MIALLMILYLMGAIVTLMFTLAVHPEPAALERSFIMLIWPASITLFIIGGLWQAMTFAYRQRKQSKKS